MKLEIKTKKVVTGTEFMNKIWSVKRNIREKLIVEHLLDGCVPEFLKELEDISLFFLPKDSKEASKLTLSVAKDYLCIGTDDDYVRIPMSPLSAQQVMDAYNCTLPTSSIVSLIWRATDQKLEPMPWGAPYDASMMSSYRYKEHNSRINNQIKNLGFDPKSLIVGHKKDVVLTNLLSKHPDQVAIYGWHRSTGKNIQPLYLGHESTYADYSHGIRLVTRECLLDNNRMDILDLLRDERFCHAISSEGVLNVSRQPKS